MSTEIGRESLDAPTTPKASTENTAVATPQRSIQDAPPVQDVETRARLDRVLQSDIGINTLLIRLKQSIGSAREVSGFLRERASLEEKHAAGIQKMTRSTHDLVGRPEHRQGSFAFNYREVGVIHDRMAKNSEDFAHNLVAMSDELQELAAHCERARKQWKHTGLEAEQKAQDADGAMEKAKQRYFSLAEQYDRVRTGERQGGKFGLKGPKSAAQQEESLLSKAENADQEYRSRVEAAQAQRHELLASSRPHAIRELQNAIMECDAAVSMQLQKFAVLNEKLLLGNGLCISPLKGQENGTAAGSRSLRDVAQGINNSRDYEEFVLSHNSKVGPTPSEIRYEKHPALTPSGLSQQQQQQQHQAPYQSQPPPNMYPPPQRSDTGFNTLSGPPRADTGFNTLSGPPRTDTGFNSVGSRVNQGGQTSGIISNQPSSQHGPYHTPQSTTATRAPQLPQIGGLSMGSRNSLEGNRAETLPQRGENDYGYHPGQTQTRPGQQPYSGPTEHTPSSPGSTAHQQVTSNYGMPGPGTGRGQAPGAGGIGGTVQSGPPGPGQGPGTGPGQGQVPYQQGSRGPPAGQPTDFRPDGRGQPQGSGYQTYPADSRIATTGPPYQGPQSDGRGVPQGSGNRGYPLDARNPQQGAGVSSNMPAGRGAPIGPGYQTHPPDTRGLPSQSASMGAAGRGGPNTHVSPVTGASGNGRGPAGRPNLPPLRPVFGVPLDELFRRDGAAVPAIVYQCIRAVDLFGLNTEGIYRISGSAQHIMELQALFDHDSSQVDFGGPTAFYNDIASVTTLLKHFLRDLPDPLLTSAQYNSFIQAAKIEDDIVRRDSLHAIINALPDPNYATLRTLVLHLNRVGQHSAKNRMTTSNLAIVFGPTLMGGQGGGPGGVIQDAGWQARVIETILNNTMQIFDDDD